MKNIILQHWTGELGELEKLSNENMMSYAEFCNADYKLLLGNVFDDRLLPPCQKLHMLSEEFDKYDIVVMIDLDSFTRKGNTANIFSDTNGIGRHFGIQKNLREGLGKRLPHLCNAKYPYWGGSLYRLERDVRVKLRDAIDKNVLNVFGQKNHHDEGIMHHLATKIKMPETKDIYLDHRKWNHSSYEPDVIDSNIIHIRPKVTPSGPKKPKIENYRELVKRGII